MKDLIFAGRNGEITAKKAGRKSINKKTRGEPGGCLCEATIAHSWIQLNKQIEYFQR
jgi:hypothetical protein